MKDNIISKCKILLDAYNTGKLGNTIMPEDSSPNFLNKEMSLIYFTLPMSLNYQRDSYKLWESALKTYKDNKSKIVFNLKSCADMDIKELKKRLVKHKIALQPNKQPIIWQTISKTIVDNWGSITNLLESSNYDFLKLKEIIQVKFKKGFPYLSGPKIFNYWTFIIQKYCKIDLKNSKYIEIAPDTHITKCSVILEVITKKEAENLSKEMISKRWREILKGTGINPIDMHSPLWFWSRNGFKFKL